MRSMLLPTMSALVLWACADQTATRSPDVQTPPAPLAQSEPASAGACAIIASRNWSAHLNTMPGPHAVASLNVAGELDLPTTGYSVTLREGPADRSARPVQDLVLTATAPTEVVLQVVTRAAVTYSGPAISQHYAGVRITCGGRALAEIEVTTVQ